MDTLKPSTLRRFLLFCLLLSFGTATITINEIIGPDSVKWDTDEEVILKCDFEAPGEEGVVLKWFYNGLDNQIFQWIVGAPTAYALGTFKDYIDPSYRTTVEGKTRFNGLKFKELNTGLSGNYTCQVDSDNDVKRMNKQLTIYAPATTFQMSLIGEGDDLTGDEVILCQANEVSPKPNFDIFIAGPNDTLEASDVFETIEDSDVDDEGFYNVSISLQFNSSHLEETTKFVCLLSIPGTNYSDTKSVEYSVENGNNRLNSLLLLPFLLALSLVFAT